MSRALAGWQLLRVAVITLGLAWLAMFGAVAYAATIASMGIESLLAAAGALILALTGILYAWREPER